MLIYKYKFGKIFATQLTKGFQPYYAESSHKVPINRPTTQLKTEERIQMGIFQERNFLGEKQVLNKHEKMLKLTNGDAMKDTTLHPSDQEKNFKAINTYYCQGWKKGVIL